MTYFLKNHYYYKDLVAKLEKFWQVLLANPSQAKRGLEGPNRVEDESKGGIEGANRGEDEFKWY